MIRGLIAISVVFVSGAFVVLISVFLILIISPFLILDAILNCVGNAIEEDRRRPF